MQERYTKQAENVLALAKEAASSCGHSYICLLYTSPSPRDTR